MIAASTRLGMREVADINETGDARVGLPPATIHRGRRVSAATAFLHPVRHRSQPEGRHAVTRRTAGLRERARRRRRHPHRPVVLRGPRPPRGHRVPGRARLAEVVAALRNRATGRALRGGCLAVPRARQRRAAGCATTATLVNTYRLNADLGYNSQLSTRLAKLRTGMRLPRHPHGSARHADRRRPGDLQDRSDAASGGRADARDAPHRGSPERGRPVRRSRRRRASPAWARSCARPRRGGAAHHLRRPRRAVEDVEPNYLGSEHDRRIAVDVLARMREFFAHEPIAGRLSSTRPSPGRAYAPTEAGSSPSRWTPATAAYHAIGTCAMGRETAQGRTSSTPACGSVEWKTFGSWTPRVLPAMVSGNLNGPVMAMAWQAADLILDGQHQRTARRRPAVARRLSHRRHQFGFHRGPCQASGSMTVRAGGPRTPSGHPLMLCSPTVHRLVHRLVHRHRGIHSAVVKPVPRRGAVSRTQCLFLQPARTSAQWSRSGASWTESRWASELAAFLGCSPCRSRIPRDRLDSRFRLLVGSRGRGFGETSDAARLTSAPARPARV